MNPHPKPYPGDELFWQRAYGGVPEPLLSKLWRFIRGRPSTPEEHEDLTSY